MSVRFLAPDSRIALVILILGVLLSVPAAGQAPEGGGQPADAIGAPGAAPERSAEPTGRPADGAGPRTECAYPAQLNTSGKPPDACPSLQEGVPAVVRLEERMVVHVTGLDAWLDAEEKQPSDLRLFLEGIEIPKLEPESVQAIENTRDLSKMGFRLSRTADNRDAWRSLLSPFDVDGRVVTVGVGIAGGQEIAGSSEARIRFQPVREKRLLAWVVLIVILLILFFFVPMPSGGKLSDSLRDRQAVVQVGEWRPLSLARCQMAWWFFLVLASYIFLWLVLGDLDTITGSVVTLIGIGSGTALGAGLIDAGKKSDKERAEVESAAAKAAGDEIVAQTNHLMTETPPTATDLAAAQAALVQTWTVQGVAARQARDLAGAVKKGRAKKYGGLNDLLKDDDGYSFHRFQIVVWTIVLGVIFAKTVVVDLAMPQFSETLLGLMGISAGTYLGFKFPERHK